ncbi:MAG: ComF family protein [Acidobacteriota bacterium]|nr:ComF family protein [Acidobacteriota bacterium]
MNLINPVLSFVFPVFCGVCRRIVEEASDGPACSSCWAATRIYEGSGTFCAKCGVFHSETDSNIKTFCRRCDELAFDLARSIGPFEIALRAVILELKRTPQLPARIGDSLFDCYAREPYREVGLLVPVPLSRKRLMERGFNQAEIIARALSVRSGIPVDCLSLVREKHTKLSRANMDFKGRTMTVAKAFAVRRRSLIESQRVLIVDDVFTSGATVSAAAKALKEGGAARVDVLTIARAGS